MNRDQILLKTQNVLVQLESAITILVDGWEARAIQRIVNVQNALYGFMTELVEEKLSQNEQSILALRQSLKKIDEAYKNLVLDRKPIISYRKLLGIKDKLIRFFDLTKQGKNIEVEGKDIESNKIFSEKSE